MTISEVANSDQQRPVHHLHSVEWFLKPPTNRNNREYNSALIELDQDRRYFQKLEPYLRASMKEALTPIIQDVLTHKFKEVKLDAWFDALMEKIVEDWDKSMDLLDRSWEIQNEEVEVITVRQEERDVFMGPTEEEGEVDRDEIFMSSPELHPGPETPEQELPEVMVFESMEEGNEITALATEINMEDPSDSAASPESADLSNSSEISGDLGLSNLQGATNSETNVLRDLALPLSNSTTSITPQMGAGNGTVSYASGPTIFEEMDKENTPRPPEGLEGAEVNSIETPPMGLNPEQVMQSLRV